MGILAAIKTWIGKPLDPNHDLFSLTVYVGIIVALVGLWALLLRQIERGFEIVE